MKVFVTGGMGFIGSHIAVELLRQGANVSILARNASKIPRFKTTPGIAIIEGGLDNVDIIAAALPGHDACIHNAIIWDAEPTELQLKDVRASVDLFKAASEAGVQKLVYTSSVAVHRPFKPR